MNPFFAIIKQLVIVSFFLITVSGAQAEVQKLRWTGASDKDASLSHIIERINQEFGLQLVNSDFLLLEERDLAHHHYIMFAQTFAGIPVRGASIRTWTQFNTGEALQVEVFVEDTKPNLPIGLAQSKSKILTQLAPAASQNRALKIAREAVQSHGEDNKVQGINAYNSWENGQLVRVIEIRSRRGNHEFTFAMPSAQVLRHEYHSFPQDDANMISTEFSLPANVFPIYEEAPGGILQKTVRSELKYLKANVPAVTSDLYEELKKQKYYDAKYDTLLAAIPNGQAQGYWSTAVVKNKGLKILNSLPLRQNSFSHGGVILNGRYATVSLHPAVKEKFQGLNFVPSQSAELRFDWYERFINNETVFEMVPTAGLLGRPLVDENDALTRPTIKDPDNNPVTYLNQGFDEVQVYYGITTLFDSLHAMGFTDPELSTRPFNAFLYDPDLTMKNNAYYTDDTINFTTYDKNETNFARDNSTIWHELGHGVMDRLMGDYIRLADTGGLSEGMADFIAALVIEDVSAGEPFDGSEAFRIINQTGFNLTNEVHDDGEAYGGSMKDMLDAAIAQYGRMGLVKIADLTLESMRLTRNHPALTANDWFEHMLFADELGRVGLRLPGELRSIILTALNNRNFSLEGKPAASFSLKNDAQEVELSKPGTRDNPIPVSLFASETKTYRLNVSLADSEIYQFQFPVRVRVGFTGRPIQGAIHWLGEENPASTYTLTASGQVLPIDITIAGTCDYINRDDGSCVDYADIQILNDQGDDNKPVAKKRFYLRLKTKE